jgi:CelD/BcsL family acetyltransferase involved in cellulose biosynthesis
MQQPRVDVLRDRGSFERIESDWNDLVERSNVLHPYLTPEWLSTWWDCFGGDATPNLLVGWDDDRAVAAAPLMLERRWICGLPFRSLELMANAHTPRADLLLAGDEERALRTLWNHLRGDRTWDVLVLKQLPADSFALRRLPELAAENGFRTGVWHASDSPYVEFDRERTWEEFLRSLGKKRCTELRRRRRGLEKRGQVAVEHLHDSGDVAGAASEAWALEAAAWKREAGTAILSSPACERFYTTLARIAAERGWMRLGFLSVDARRIAMNFVLRYKSRAYLMKSGYDPSYGRYGPTHLLIEEDLRQAFSTGVEQYDLLGDNDTWKRDWTHTTRDHTWLFVFARGWKSLLAHRAKFHYLPKIRRRSVS